MRIVKPGFWQNKLLVAMAAPMILIPLSVLIWRETLHPTGADVMAHVTMSIFFALVLLQKAGSGLRCGTPDLTVGILMLAYAATDFAVSLPRRYVLIWVLSGFILVISAYFTGVNLLAMNAEHKRRKAESEALSSQP